MDLTNDITIEKHYGNPLKENFTIDGHESEIKDITQNSFKENISLQVNFILHLFKHYIVINIYFRKKKLIQPSLN